MPLLTQSALLRALGWSLFNSLWQMSLLWAIYHLVLLVFKDLSARTRHRWALLLLTLGFTWSVTSFVSTYFFTDAVPVLLPFPGYARWMADLVLPWCSSLYLLTLAVLLFHYSRQYIRSKRIIHEGLSPLAPAFDVFVSSTARRMGIGAKVRAHLSSLVEVPVTLGLLKPVILLPVSMITQLTSAQIEAILVHELAHIRRKDYLLNLLVTVMELLYFFNPFARRLIAQLKKEREHCCDDAVLEFRYDPHAYVTALLSLARQHRQASLAVAAIGGGEQLLLQRARKILQQKRTDDRPGPRPLVGLLLTTLVSILILGHSRPVGTTAQQLARRLTVRPAVRFEAMSLLLVNNSRHAAPMFPRLAGVHYPALHPAPHANRHPRNLVDAILTASVHGSNPITLVVNTAETGPDDRPVSAFADLLDTVNRDYSMGGSDENQPDVLPDPPARTGNTPFVPQSSFAFRYTDTLPPEEKLALMQELSRKALELQVLRLQTELEQQLLMLREQEKAVRRASLDESRAGLANTIESKSLRALLQQQQQVQQQYMINLEKLQRQLQKASRHLTIVYI
jgi:beta-lactamase regulating signal transducer with metallopeptidase domain